MYYIIFDLLGIVTHQMNLAMMTMSNVTHKTVRLIANTSDTVAYGRMKTKPASHNNTGKTTMLCLPPYPCGPSTGYSFHLPYLPLFLPSAFQCCRSFNLREVATPPLPPTNVRSSNMSARLKLSVFMPCSAHNVYTRRSFSQLQAPTSLSSPHGW